jgi:ATP-binding cassette, subfamily B, bacterial MsbA
MNNFWRALGYTWPYRRRLYLSLACSLFVAILWGANLSAIYPALTVLLDGKTLAQWIDESQSHELKEIQRVKKEIDVVNGDVAKIEDEKRIQHRAELDAKLSERRGELARRQSELSSRERKLAWYAWFDPVVRNWTPSTAFQTLALLMGVMIFGVALKGLFDFLQEYLATGVVQLAVFDLRNEYFRKALNLDLTHFSEHGTHDLMARGTNDLETLYNGMKALYGKVLMEPLKVVSCLAFAWMFNWRLTLLTIVLFGIAPVVIGSIGRYLKRMSRRNLESIGAIYKILHESFLGVRVVKAFAMERYERSRLFRENKRYYHQAMKLNRTEALSSPVLEFLAVSAIAVAILCGSYLVLTQTKTIWGVRLTDDPIDPSMMLTFYALIAGMFDPLRKMLSVYGRVQRGVAAADRVFHAIDRESRVPQKPRAPTLPKHRKEIEFDSVSFGYKPGRTVLNGVNLRVEFGETVALVGPTGCGKTSLINLLPRFYDAIAGAVKIDGVDIRDVSLHSLRRQIGMVTQQTLLFDDTIFNNIAYGDRNADKERIVEAAKAAYAHKFIEDLPHGYETTIGELGATLSGGQCQRIALARAILRDPPILILDEATSSLDLESEALIHRALAQFTKGRTTFIVTHRLSVLDIADRIVVVNNGRIEAVGTETDLLKASGTFRRLCDVQAKGA